MTKHRKKYEDFLPAERRAELNETTSPLFLRPERPSFAQLAPMRDEVGLYTEVFLPEGAEDQNAYPVILVRSPYAFSRPSKHDTHDIARYLDAGYAFVFQLCRGRGASQGAFSLFSDVEDGYDCVQWVADQSWCNGNVGMQGYSYDGFTQMCAAKEKPPALKCVIPTAFIGNRLQCHPYTNGIFMRNIYLNWAKTSESENYSDLAAIFEESQKNGLQSKDAVADALKLVDLAGGVLSERTLPLWRDVCEKQYDTDYWSRIHYREADLAAIDIPMLFIDGWYDATIGPIDHFARAAALGGAQGSHLLVGPWSHVQTYRSAMQGVDNGEWAFPENGYVDFFALRRDFFDRYLKGKTDVSIQKDKVRAYVTGADCWLDLPSFPAPNTQEASFYLHGHGHASAIPSDGVLSADEPGDEPADYYQYDPEHPPSPAWGMLADLRENELRADVLTYTTAPLDAAVTILGEMVLELHASTDGRDTDWFAQVTEVFPDGRSIPFHGPVGALRGRYHQGLDREALLTPNEPTLFTLRLGPAGHQIPAGHRLRLSIFSACAPAFDRNRNTGNDPATDLDMRVAQQTVFHDQTRPSRLILPTIKLEDHR